MASLDDGLLDLSLIEMMNFTKILFKLPHAFKGTHLKEREVFYARGVGVLFKAATPIFIQTDGELVEKPVLEGKVRVLKRSFKILQPI
jgi:diacylglycerol kinase family enzyme